MLTCTDFSVIFSVKASSKAKLMHVELNVETLLTENIYQIWKNVISKKLAQSSLIWLSIYFPHP
jgi:hypothetical protein